MSHARRGRRSLALLLCAMLCAGCYAPRALTPSKPYSPIDRNVFAQTYYGAYDASVGLQLLPIPIVELAGWERGERGREVTLWIAMPIATLGMLIFGSIALPFVPIFQKA